MVTVTYEEQEHSNKILTRQLGLFDSAMMMGIVIGSVIFLAPGNMTQAFP